MRKTKREKLLNEIKKEIGFEKGKSFYKIKPSYLDKVFEEAYKTTRCLKNEEVYVIVTPNGNMPSFVVTNYWDIHQMIEYSYKEYDTLELHINIYDTIKVSFEDNSYNKYTIYFKL